MLLLLLLSCSSSSDDKRIYLDGYSNVYDHYKWENQWVLISTNYLNYNDDRDVSGGYVEYHSGSNEFINILTTNEYVLKYYDSGLLFEKITNSYSDNTNVVRKYKTVFESYAGNNPTLLSSYYWDYESESWVKSTIQESQYIDGDILDSVLVRSFIGDSEALRRIEYSYSSMLQVEIVEFYSISLVDQSEILENRWVYSYENNLKSVDLFQIMSDEGWIDTSRRMYSYVGDKQNSIIFQNWENESWVNSTKNICIKC